MSTQNRVNVVSIERSREGLLFGLGNPLMDIIATVDKPFLAKYNLNPDDSVVRTGHEQAAFFEELERNYKVEYVAGGSAQNSFRVAQRIIGKPNVATFMGSIGNDEYGKTLSDCARNDGVNGQYQIQPNAPTGTCAVLITGTERSLCAYLAAAKLFTLDYLLSPTHFAYVEKAQFYYISGFFLTVSTESFQRVAKYAASKNRPFMLNLSAAFISREFIKELNDAMPYVDVIFGNAMEAKSYAECQNFDTNDKLEIAKKVAELPKENEARQRLVVFTQGSDSVIVVEEGNVTTFNVTRLPSEKIKDTNGAGDGFVGGFLAQYIQGKPIESCVKCGIWAASEILQHTGCQLPKDMTYLGIRQEQIVENERCVLCCCSIV